MILKHFQMCGHRPVALIGGATGMIGDPSGKSRRRSATCSTSRRSRRNQEAIRRQLAKLPSTSSPTPRNAALLVNNYDWMKEFSFLGFIRDIGKLITVNYMMAKDSVETLQWREGDGMSFTEIHLPAGAGLRLPPPLQRRSTAVFSSAAPTSGATSPPARSSSAARPAARPTPSPARSSRRPTARSSARPRAATWLDPRYTSPYKFYQFWLNVSDDDAKRYIRIFTLLDRGTIEALVAEHDAAPHLRLLQKRLAEELTVMIHSRGEYEKAVEASAILFGGSTAGRYAASTSRRCSRSSRGVPCFTLPRAELGGAFVELFAGQLEVFPLEGRVPQAGAGRRRVAQQGEGDRPAASGRGVRPDRGQIPARAARQEELLPRDRRVAMEYRIVLERMEFRAYLPRVLRPRTARGQPFHGRSGDPGRTGRHTAREDSGGKGGELPHGLRNRARADACHAAHDRTVAENIIGTVRAAFPQIVSVRCTVSKLAPPLGGKLDRVSVVLER